MGLFKNINDRFSADLIRHRISVLAKARRLAFHLMGWAFLLGGGLALSLWAEGVPGRSTKQAWTVVRESLTSNDSVVREQAVQGLEEIDGEVASKALLSALSDESEYVRIWSARALAKRGDSSGKRAMLNLLSSSTEMPKDDNNPLSALIKMRALARGRVRGEAAKVLGLIRDPEVVPTLKMAKRDNDGRVRDGAAVALALMGDESEAFVFASALKDEDRGVRLAAVEALGAIGLDKSAYPVARLLNDTEEDVRAAAVKTLGYMKASEFAEPVQPLLMDTSGRVRENAAWALGEMGSASAIPHLKTMLQDPNVYNQLAAAEALAKMKDSSGLSVIEAALASNDLDGRIRAASVLQVYRDRGALGLATKTMEDGNIRVRLGASLAILKMDQRKK
jgi:HEAT repeat protein